MKIFNDAAKGSKSCADSRKELKYLCMPDKKIENILDPSLCKYILNTMLTVCRTGEICLIAF